MNRNSRRGMYFDDDNSVTVAENFTLDHEYPKMASETLATQPFLNPSKNPHPEPVSTPTPGQNQNRWSSGYFSKRLSMIVWDKLNAASSNRQRQASQNQFRFGQSSEIGESGQHNSRRRMFSCQEVFCFTLIPCVILSLVAIGVSSMLIYIHLMQQYQEKILKLQESLSKVNFQLSSESLKTSGYEKTLSCVQSVIKRSEFDKIEQINREISIQCFGARQEDFQMPVADEAFVLKKTKDKLEKKRYVKSPTDSSSTTTPPPPVVQQEISTSQAKLAGIVTNYVDHQSNFCSKFAKSLGSNLDRRSKEKGVLANTYTEAVTKLIEITSEIESIASDNMYKEQAWVEKVLKRLRNEADLQSQSIHKFLVDNVLVMHADVLASVGNLRKTVQELSLKTDKTLDSRIKNVNLHLGQSEKHHKSDIEFSINFFAKMDQRNKQIVDALKSEELIEAEYLKKSGAIVNQFKNLLSALMDSEQRFLADAKKSRLNVFDQLAKNAEDLASFQTKKQEKENRFFSARDKLKNELENEHNKFGSEKSQGFDNLGVHFAKVSDSVEKIREQAETFVNRGKDAWNLHYAETETALRQRSDESLQHLTGFQGKTQQLKMISRESQSNLEGLVESSQVADERDVQAHQSDISTKCEEISNFGNNIRDELRQGRQLQNLSDEDRRKVSPHKK